GGDKWQTVADASLNVGQGGITSIDVGYDAEDNPYVFIGTTVGFSNGTVFYVAQGGYPAQWTDLDVQLNGFNFNVYAVAASPEFTDTDEIFAVCSNSTATVVLRNLHGSVGDWEEVAELLDDEDNPFDAVKASRICFPDDFDDGNYEFFAGVCDLGTEGTVFRVNEDHAYNLGKEDSDILTDVISLDVVGSYGGTSLIAGAWNTSDNKVIYSTDDGDSWDDASKEPSGNGDAWVVMDEDFADSGIAWAACNDIEGAVSLTVDGGDMYNQISLVSTDINSVDDFSFSPNYATDETMFLLTSRNPLITDSLWRYDGDYWERVFVSTLQTPDLDTITKVQVSPDFPRDETVYVVHTVSNGFGGPILYRSTDGGNDWDALSNNPPDYFGLNGWLVLDTDTVITGGDEVVWKTTNHGRRAWDDYDVDHVQTIWSFAVSPNFANDDTLLLGDRDGQIFISENIGEDWD
ncbi:MAG: hypothetical protein KAT75_01845, partial [Dehalococcoidia bacterium]|nr:hypothetical protein [Dehalococcoidia bacterium]